MKRFSHRSHITAEPQPNAITPSLPSPLPVESLGVEREEEGFDVSSLRSELRVEDSRTVRVGGMLFAQ
jgi:hypothetical protein